MRISYSQHRSNKMSLRKAVTERTVIKNIREIQLEFPGHVISKDGMENLFISGFIDGKRSKGRQRAIYVEIFCK